ncbi:MAG: DUF3108 domain-containing protein [Acidobacteriota bacterium]|nr:DUF3108 domain-containing protein [Acidobacteriota bacterium]
MNIIRRISVTALLLVVSASAFGADLKCNTAGNVEEFRYSWRLRGGVRFLAGLMFPTSGVGNLKTTYGDTVHSELLITAPNGKQGGYYAYESDMDERGSKTLMTYHGYAWGNKSRQERTIFDYVKGLVRIHKQTPDDSENRVRKLPADQQQFRDILTAIQFLRTNAQTITRPLQTSIFSDGKEYPVVFQPGEKKTFTVEGKVVSAIAFNIVDAPGGKKWPGGVKVWLSNDERRIPVRMEITQSLAALQLDLKQVESCKTLVAGLY